MENVKEKPKMMESVKDIKPQSDTELKNVVCWEVEC
jgi:hypothetical protein